MQEKWINHLAESFSFHAGDLEGGGIFFFWGLRLEEGEGGLKPWKFVRRSIALRNSLRGAKEFWNWFWFPKDATLLLCWPISHLSQLGQVCLAAPQWWLKWVFFGWVFLLVEWWPFYLFSFLIILGGSPRMNFPLSLWTSLSNSILDSLFLEISVLVGGTKIIPWEALEEVS